jgi:hypothetical protein
MINNGPRIIIASEAHMIDVSLITSTALLVTHTTLRII